jgi:uncharacterized protein YbaP (TraB family)
MGNSFVDSIPVIKNTLLKSDVAIFESIDDEAKLANALQKRKKQNELKYSLSDQDYSTLKKISKNWRTSLSVLKPIEVLLTLRREFQILKCKTVKPTDKWNHFDNYLIEIAKKNKINIQGLETDSLQLSILDEIEKSWSKDLVSQEISFWISKLNIKQDSYEECQESQQYQRLEIDYKFDNECEDDVLIAKRNEKWIPLLLKLFSKQNCFLAVGLLHLKYNCGLLESFRRNGFNVKPVIIEKASR